LCDFICDSNIGFRQLIARNRKSLFVQPLKNLSQLLLICISSIVNIENNDSLIAFCIALPAITLIFYDTTRVGGFTKPKLIYHLKRSWKYLLQSGGNAILTLDFFIIANSSNLQTIAYLALARRILNAWSNLAQAAAPRLQYEIAEYRYISRESLRKLFALIGLILLGICLVAFFLGRIFSFFLDTSLTGEDTAFGQAVMFIGFIHIINNYANAILLGRMKFKEIALATYAGSISYLVILSLLSQSQNPYFFIPISSLFGACLTLSLFAGFIRREFVSR
jgi:hypothetical protein